jgi:hypothetical protein
MPMSVSSSQTSSRLERTQPDRGDAGRVQRS